MSNIKVKAETFATENVVEEALQMARNTDPNAGVAEVLRDANGKVVEVKIALPNADAAGLATAKEAITTNPGVAKSGEFPKSISEPFTGVASYGALADDTSSANMGGIATLASTSDIDVKCYGYTSPINTFALGTLDPVVARATGYGFAGADSGNAIIPIIPHDASVAHRYDHNAGIGLFAKNLQQVTAFSLEMTLSRASGTLSYSNGVSGASRDMDVVDTAGIALPQFSQRFAPPIGLVYNLQVSSNWTWTNGADTGISANSPVTLRFDWQNGTLMPYINGSLVTTEVRNLYVSFRDLQFLAASVHQASSGDNFFKQLKIDNLSYKILDGQI